eukprot:COSAG05_NODE_1678_length_4291_cov_649.414122_2_plen_180_part_00
MGDSAATDTDADTKAGGVKRKPEEDGGDDGAGEGETAKQQRTEDEEKADTPAEEAAVEAPAEASTAPAAASTTDGAPVKASGTGAGVTAPSISNEEIVRILRLREVARADKNWAVADEHRETLVRVDPRSTPCYRWIVILLSSSPSRRGCPDRLVCSVRKALSSTTRTGNGVLPTAARA